MASQVGTIAHLQWITSSATLTLSTDQRTITTEESVDLIDETAGADANKQYIVSYKDGKAGFAGLYQAGGTAIFSAAPAGQIGTLKYAPDGSVAGSVLITIPAISNGVKTNSVYNGLVEVSIDWQQNGTKTYGTL